MSECESLSGDQREFEQLLQQLMPADPGIDVAELMFRAGRESADGEYRRRLRRWQGATFATAACAIVMAAFLAWPAANGSSRPTQYAGRPDSVPMDSRADRQEQDTEHQDDTVVADAPRPVPADPKADSQRSTPLFSSLWKSLVSVQTPADDSYLSLRNRVFESGVDSLPERTTGSASSKEPLSTSPGRVRDYINRELGPGLL